MQEAILMAAPTLSFPNCPLRWVVSDVRLVTWFFRPLPSSSAAVNAACGQDAHITNIQQPVASPLMYLRCPFVHVYVCACCLQATTGDTRHLMLYVLINWQTALGV